jgi:NADH-quinone oxidoreductase subunit N
MFLTSLTSMLVYALWAFGFVSFLCGIHWYAVRGNLGMQISRIAGNRRQEKFLREEYYLSRDRNLSYECGFESFNETRASFDVHFYKFAILYIVLDLEIAFLFPWTISSNFLIPFAFWVIWLFLGILAAGFVYEWQEGVLDWSIPVPALLLVGTSGNFDLSTAYEFVASVATIFYYVPEILLTLLIIFLLVFPRWRGRLQHSGVYLRMHSGILSYVFVPVTIYSVLFFMFLYYTNISLCEVSGFLPSVYTAVLRIFLLGFFILLFFSSTNRLFLYPLRWEAVLLFCIVLLLLLFLIQVNDFFMFYLVLEGINLALYVLLALGQRRSTTEASLKYFVLNGFIGCVLLFSILNCYIVCGSTNFSVITEVLHSNWVVFGRSTSDSILLTVATSLLLIVLLFKLSAAPLHFWTPDVYTGAWTPVTYIMATVLKLSMAVVALRILSGPLHAVSTIWLPLLFCAGWCSIYLGCLGALAQQGLKRFLAWSAVHNIGFFVLALTFLSSTTKITGGPALFYIVSYVIVTSLIFVFLILVSVRSEYVADKSEISVFDELIFFTDFSILARSLYLQFFPTVPLTAVLSVLFFVAAGLPPFLGFYSKYFVLVGLFQNYSYFSVFLVLLSTIISVYYYIRIVKYLLFEVDTGDLRWRDVNIVSVQGPWVFQFSVLGVLFFFGISSIFLLFFSDGLMSYGNYLLISSHCISTNFC